MMPSRRPPRYSVREMGRARIIWSAPLDASLDTAPEAISRSATRRAGPPASAGGAATSRASTASVTVTSGLSNFWRRKRCAIAIMPGAPRGRAPRARPRTGPRGPRRRPARAPSRRRRRRPRTPPRAAAPLRGRARHAMPAAASAARAASTRSGGTRTTARRREAASPVRVSVRVRRPWSMKTTRSQTRSTSLSWCEFRTIVAPRALAARICSRTMATPRGSVPDAGSSRKSSAGSRSVACAMPMRCSMPRE